jgi:hypothetical protein
MQCPVESYGRWKQAQWMSCMVTQRPEILIRNWAWDVDLGAILHRLSDIPKERRERHEQEVYDQTQPAGGAVVITEVPDTWLCSRPLAQMLCAWARSLHLAPSFS